MNRNILFAGIALLLIVAAYLYVENAPGKYDGFAKCLSDSGAKMYGSYWCTHCKAQKDAFGNSWKYVNYVECSLPDNSGQTQECTDAGIHGYPTWEFGDGSRQSGELSFTLLSLKSGCALENS